MKKAAGYIRVSTDEQARGGISLDMQRSKVETYCVLEDLDLVEVIADEGLSATTIKRPGIQRILNMVRHGQVDAVVTYKLDRVARNTLDALSLSTLMDRHNVALHSICEKIDTKSAMGRFFFTLLAALAEMESGTTSERVRDTMQRLRDMNRPRSQNAPYGFMISGSILVPNQKELAVIGKVLELRKDGLTIYRITKMLSEAGVYNRRGKPFDKNQIRNIILREAA